MPRIHINVNGIDEIEELEEQEGWEHRLGLADAGQRREARPEAGQRRQRGFHEQRFGGGEALDRKRSERRKQVFRSGRRV
jgi:hypothetical protein